MIILVASLFVVAAGVGAIVAGLVRSFLRRNAIPTWSRGYGTDGLYGGKGSRVPFSGKVPEGWAERIDD
jgi:hypothetical protein